jgi:uncharacterized protein (DUF1697 family)
MRRRVDGGVTVPNAYVALLRGINVGRAKRVAMADLRTLVEDLGYGNVRTLLNSGNVVFTASRTAAGAASRIEKALAVKLSVAARVTVLSAAEFATAVSENALLDRAKDPSRLMVAFFSKPADRSKLGPLLRQDWGAEALALGGRVAYVWCPQGFLASPLADAVGRALGDAVTMRNWATVTRIFTLIDD